MTGSLDNSTSSSVMFSEELDVLLWPSMRARYQSAWHGHVSFAHWVVYAMRPRVVVELGTHHGVSYAAFCASVQKLGLDAQCHAVDTWEGDQHAGRYSDFVYDDVLRFNASHFARFSHLHRSTFDGALDLFEDGSVDLLHIDGFHTYEAVRHDYETWAPKLSDRSVVLFHDTEVHDADFGVHRLWAELSPQSPSFGFQHAYGLGVLAHGHDVPAMVQALCQTTAEQADAVRMRFMRCSENAYLGGLKIAGV